MKPSVWLSVFFVFLVFSFELLAQECSHLWNKNLEIDPVEPKGYSGDSFAGYGLMGYQNKEGLGWVFKGKFPRGRFMSIETYTTTHKHRYDVQFDYQIEPDNGSENPFREGVFMDTPERSFTVTLVPAEGKSTIPNIIHISPTEKVHAIYYRIYAPSDGELLTESDLPAVYAYDHRTGEPTNCPNPANVVFAPNFPQVLANVAAWVTDFEFKETTVNNGQNSAIPYYVWAINKVKHGEVTIIRFKAPTFLNNQSGIGPFQKTGEVRYWSLCTQNFVKSLTLNCIPDYLAKVDPDGYANVVIGKGADIQDAAEKFGYSFLEDRRDKRQKVEEFAYRNLLPNEEFEHNQMYKGAYLPIGITCSAEQFLSGECH
ncbi:MAG: hypothetical protein HY537_10320 [Deltaproteobacteria bacterium]|nr:hypothetical protein [Deltaproteobacteria bacterium]